MKTLFHFVIFVLLTLLFISSVNAQLSNRNFTLYNNNNSANYIQVPFTSSMNMTSITIEFWIEFTNYSDTGYAILNKGNYPNIVDYGIGYGYGQYGLRLTFVAKNITIQLTDMDFNSGIWYHIAVTADGNQVSFYINDELYDTRTIVSPLGYSSYDIFIEKNSSASFSGYLDELRIWNVVRTHLQIDSNMCLKYPSQFTSTTGLQAIWHFDSSLVDSVSGWNGVQHGTLTYDTASFPMPGVPCMLVGINTNSNDIPKQFSLEQNFPNPFNPKTSIQFSIAKGTYVEITLYDILGKKVATLLKEPKEAGTYKIYFDGSNFPSGVYLYKISAGYFSDVKKMVILK